MEKVNCVTLHGVRLDMLDMAGALERVNTALAGEGRVAVFTPNAEMIYRSAAERRLAGILNRGDINVADGVGAVWAARRLCTPLPGRVPGIELGEAVIANCAAGGVPVYLLGGARGVAERAALRLEAKHPGLKVAGTHHGYFNYFSSENAAVLRDINDKSPELLIVCFGFPRQEEWIVRNRENLPSVKVLMGLGGSLDVWADNVRRAPVIFRRAGLEWLWRIVRSPSRLGRAAALPAFVFMTLREKRRRRLMHEERGEAPRGASE